MTSFEEKCVYFLMIIAFILGLALVAGTNAFSYEACSYGCGNNTLPNQSVNNTYNQTFNNTFNQTFNTTFNNTGNTTNGTSV